jgi:hypothetical protein
MQKRKPRPCVTVVTCVCRRANRSSPWRTNMQRYAMMQDEVQGARGGVWASACSWNSTEKFEKHCTTGTEEKDARKKKKKKKRMTN